MSASTNSRAGVRLDVDRVSVDLSGRRIIDTITLTAAGELVGVVGPNGSGKSTLLRSIYRMIRPCAGDIVADGKSVWELGTRAAARMTAAVVQDAPTDVELSVVELVTTGRVPHGRWFDSETEDDRTAVEHAMTVAGVTAFASRQVSSLSGGERQRVHLARALAQQPRILVLDEPTNHLDIRHQLELLAIVRDLGVTTLVTLHDLNLAAAFCDRVVVLSHGEVVADGAPGTVFTTALLHRVFGVESAPITNPLTGRTQLVFNDGSSP